MLSIYHFRLASIILVLFIFFNDIEKMTLKFSSAIVLPFNSTGNVFLRLNFIFKIYEKNSFY